jgi:hypothetical protein
MAHFVYFLALFPMNRSPSAFGNDRMVPFPSLEINGTPDAFLFLPQSPDAFENLPAIGQRGIRSLESLIDLFNFLSALLVAFKRMWRS